MQAAIFDMDGTLVDSMPYWRHHLACILAENGVDYGAEMDRLVNRHGAFDLLMEALLPKHPDITRAEVIDLYQGRMQADYLTRIQPKAGALAYLSFLRERGIACCIATATPRYLYEPMLTRTGLADLVDFSITVAEIGKGKREPDIFLYCAKRYGLTAGDCAVFEDTLSALRTAAQADFYTVGVADPSAVGDEEAIETCCNRYIHSFSELAEAPLPFRMHHG